MSDYYHSLTVTLVRDVKDEDIEALKDAIGQFKLVIGVTGNVADINIHVACQRARNQLHDRLWRAFHSDSVDT